MAAPPPSVSQTMRPVIQAMRSLRPRNGKSAMQLENEGNLGELEEFLEEEFGQAALQQDDVEAESNDFDASYIEVPLGYRPAALGARALWNQIYGGAIPSLLHAGHDEIQCQENCTGNIHIHRQSKKERGTNKRPPLCHVVPFNHIKWAVDWLNSNDNGYIGPDWQHLDRGLAAEVVWDAANLRPGHAQCNSATAAQAVGAPSTQAAEGAAITYVRDRLEALRPLWFP